MSGILALTKRLEIKKTSQRPKVSQAGYICDRKFLPNDHLDCFENLIDSTL